MPLAFLASDLSAAYRITAAFGSLYLSLPVMRTSAGLAIIASSVTSGLANILSVAVVFLDRNQFRGLLV